MKTQTSLFLALGALLLNSTIMAMEPSDSTSDIARFKQMNEDAKKVNPFFEEVMEKELKDWISLPISSFNNINAVLYYFIEVCNALRPMVEDCISKGKISTTLDSSNVLAKREHPELMIEAIHTRESLCDCENSDLYFQYEMARKFRNFLQKHS